MLSRIWWWVLYQLFNRTSGQHVISKVMGPIDCYLTISKRQTASILWHVCCPLPLALSNFGIVKNKTQVCCVDILISNTIVIIIYSRISIICFFQNMRVALFRKGHFVLNRKSYAFYVCTLDLLLTGQKAFSHFTSKTVLSFFFFLFHDRK